MGAWSCSDPRKGKSWSTGRSWSCCLQFTEPQGSGPGSSKAAQNPWENPNAAPKAPPSPGLARIAAHPKIPPGGGKPGGVFGSLDVQIQVPGSMSHLGMALPKQIPAFNCSCGGSGGIFGILHVQSQRIHVPFGNGSSQTKFHPSALPWMLRKDFWDAGCANPSCRIRVPPPWDVIAPSLLGIPGCGLGSLGLECGPGALPPSRCGF